MPSKPSGRARSNSPDAKPDPDLRSLNDPLPDTLDEVQAEINYWTARRDREGPRSDNFDGILKRITHLRGIHTGLLPNQPGSGQTHQEFDGGSSSSSAAEVSSYSTPSAPIPADPWAGPTSSPVVNPDSPFAPSDSPAPADPWADGSVASSFAPSASNAPNQVPVDPFLDFTSSISATRLSPPLPQISPRPRLLLRSTFFPQALSSSSTRQTPWPWKPAARSSAPVASCLPSLKPQAITRTPPHWCEIFSDARPTIAKSIRGSLRVESREPPASPSKDFRDNSSDRPPPQLPKPLH